MDDRLSIPTGGATTNGGHRMQRRDLLRGGLALGGSLCLGSRLDADPPDPKRESGLIIDAHCHAGKGEAMTALWTSFADPEVTLRCAEEAGIDRTVIFPIENPTYEQANEEIARLVEKYPGKFIGFAKHDPVAEAGKIERLLTREVEQLGLKGLKLHKTPTREVLDVVAALGIPILFHPPKVADYHMIADAYPRVNFILRTWAASPPGTGPSTWRRSTWRGGTRTSTWRPRRSSSPSTWNGRRRNCRRRS